MSILKAKLTQRIMANMISVGAPLAMDMMDCKICHYDQGPADPADFDPESRLAIISFWHEYILSAAPGIGSSSNITALCSQHRDGEFVAMTCEGAGMNVVRGSTSKGGAAAIRQLKHFAKFSNIGLTPDGPRGPRRKMSPGAIFLAAKLGLPIIPIGIGVSNPIRLKTWDRFVIPKPWSRIRLISGPRIPIPRKVSRDQLATLSDSIEQLLNDLTDEAEKWASSGRDIEGQRRMRRVWRINDLWIDPPTPHIPRKPLGFGQWA